MNLLMLNDKQKEGVTTSSQYTRIIAGAGSGKTRVLTNRIAYLLENGLAFPHGILGITFTNKAANEIKDRVVKMTSSVSEMSLCTIHSWCAKFLRFECRYINYPKNFTILDEEDSARLMKEIFVSKGRAKNDPNIKNCLNWISSKKNQGLDYEDIKDEQYPSSELRDFLEFFKAYDKKLKETHSLDFDDLLLKAIIILKDDSNGVKANYQRRITHILVDEFQDINNVQFELITLLLSPTCELYVVGDPDQTIYTWRGANNNLIINLEKYLKSIYKNAEVKTIILNQNYRSTKNILKCANTLIAHNKERVTKDLFATQENGDDVSLFVANFSFAEANYVINTIKELHQNGTQYKDIAILYRMNFLTRELENQLNRLRIPYKIYGGLKFYQRKEIKDVLSYLTLLINPLYDLGFSRIINIPKRNIGQMSLDKLYEAANENSQSLYLYVLENNNLPLTTPKNVAIKNMVAILEHYKEVITTCEPKKIPINLQNMIFNDLNYDLELKEDITTADERKDNIMEFFSFMDQYYQSQPNPNFAEFIENCVLQSSQDDIQEGDYVSLMTVHTAKGLEFDNVFVYSLSEGIFPSMRAIAESKHGIEEERRLAYVAFTRAKKHLYLSCNQDFSYVLSAPLKPSRFIQEAGIKLKDKSENLLETKNTWSFNKIKKPTIQTHVETRTNGVKSWRIGDLLVHEIFGKGKVKDVKENDLIVVEFDNPKYGFKTLKGTHYMIKKLLN